MPKGGMNLRRLTARLIAALAIAGLAVAPLAQPVAAKTSNTVEMMDMASMSGDMPCCPDGQKNKTCQDCPFVAMCVLKNIQIGPAIGTDVPARHWTKAGHSFFDEAPPYGLNRPPPDQPPRNLI